jgi:transglutaminase-like putative cysteine protease
MEKYLSPTPFMDSDSEVVADFAAQAIEGESSDEEKAVKLYYAVRDGIRYNPYNLDLSPAGMKASAVIVKKKGYCVQKAVVLAAAARSAGIGSRLGFADVKNHLASERLKQLIHNNIYLYHGYTELFLDGRWVKATPAFNLSLCRLFGVDPLEFDGRNDSILQPTNAEGNLYMEYVNFHGTFADLPYQRIKEVMTTHYPFLFNQAERGAKGSLEEEIRHDRQ